MIRALVTLCAVLSLAATKAGEAPVFDSERLTVPRVDTKGQVAQYLDGTLVRLPSGDFRLEAVDVLGAGKVFPLRGIQSVEVRTIGALPAAVFLSVSGYDPDCDHVSPLKVSQRLVGNRFEVVISSRHLYDSTAVLLCTSVVRDFRVTAPLNVYGLKRGTYSFSVNGAHEGQFVLAADNRYPDDCHETLQLSCTRNAPLR